MNVLEKIIEQIIQQAAKHESIINESKSELITCAQIQTSNIIGSTLLCGVVFGIVTRIVTDKVFVGLSEDGLRSRDPAQQIYQELSKSEYRVANFYASTIEEGIFRLLPAYIIDQYIHDNNKLIEIVVSIVISSAVFGLVHRGESKNYRLEISTALSGLLLSLCFYINKFQFDNLGLAYFTSWVAHYLSNFDFSPSKPNSSSSSP